MKPLQLLSRSEQVAEYLRTGLAQRVWVDVMPGSQALAKQLGVHSQHAEAALLQLESEGLLVGQGRRKPRLIDPSAEAGEAVSFRIGVLPLEVEDWKLDYVVDVQHRLQKNGHVIVRPPQTISERHGSTTAIGKMMRECAADAWIVLSGSRELLKSIADEPFPSFAFAGRAKGLPLAGIAPDKLPAMDQLVQQLLGLGHRRVVLFSREARRKPVPGPVEQFFLSALEQHGIQTAGYHLPDWEEDASGFHRGLDRLFRMTPPTAIILDEGSFVPAFFQFCAGKGIQVPGDVSLACLDPDPSFAWFEPAVSHVHWESAPIVQRMVSWVHNVSRGKDDQRQSSIPAKLVPGGTIDSQSIP